MVFASHAIEVFSRILPGWYFSAIYSYGMLGGLLTRWNPHTNSFKAFRTIGGLLIEGRFLNNNLDVAVLNIYGPYKDEEVFWVSLDHCGILKSPNLIIAVILISRYLLLRYGARIVM